MIGHLDDIISMAREYALWIVAAIVCGVGYAVFLLVTR